MGIKSYITCSLKSISSAAIMGVVAYFMYYSLNKAIGNSNIGDFIALVTAASTGALLYFALIYMMRVEEFQWFVRLVKKRLFKKQGN